MTRRSATAEWGLGQAQTTTTTPVWWLDTVLLHDAAGKGYLLFNTVFIYDRKEIPKISSVPAFASKLGSNTTIFSPAIELSNSNTNLH